MGSKADCWVISMSDSRASSRHARKLTTTTGAPFSASKSSLNSTKRPLPSVFRMRLMCARTESSSRVMRGAHRLDIAHVLARELGHRDVEDIERMPADEVEQQI